jgi:hypothetical protein
MSRCARAGSRSFGSFVAGIGVLVMASGASRAAVDPEAIAAQMTAQNKAAITAYSNGDFDKAKSHLNAAVKLSAKDPSLKTHPMMARTYLHLGVLYVDGYEDKAEGIKYFVKALKIRPDIELTEALATKTVKAAFEEASHEAGPGGGAGAEETAVADKADKADKPEKPTKEDKAAAKAAAAEEKAAAKTAAAEEKAAREQEKQAAKTAAAEAKQRDAEAKQREKETAAEKDKLMKELAAAGGNEAKERAAKEKLAAEKAEKEKALGETKETLKQLTAERDKLTKDLAQVRESEAKEKAAKEKALGEKAATEKQLADAKAQIQQLTKEKAEKDKALADTGAREAKERAAKEKLEKDRQAAEAKEKERKAAEEAERQSREKLAAGPDMPGHISEPVHCAIPDEAPAGSDLYVHCVAQPNLKAKAIALYFRSGGGLVYNAIAMEPSKKGWHAAMIPGGKISGKALQYYVEARDGGGKVAASNGKATSPNILPLKSGSGGKPKAH